MYRNLRIVAFLALVVVAAGSFPRHSQAANKLDVFAKCLTAKKARMYGLYWCPHCADQKELFGSAFQYVNYIECGIPGSRGETDQCKAQKVKFFPTWEFANGTRHEGVMQINDLSKETGCPVP
jgi:hypothetical protein